MFTPTALGFDLQRDTTEARRRSRPSGGGHIQFGEQRFGEQTGRGVAVAPETSGVLTRVGQLSESAESNLRKRRGMAARVGEYL
jgi:hypothetical protein